MDFFRKAILKRRNRKMLQLLTNLEKEAAKNLKTVKKVKNPSGFAILTRDVEAVHLCAVEAKKLMRGYCRPRNLLEAFDAIKDMYEWEVAMNAAKKNINKIAGITDGHD